MDFLVGLIHVKPELVAKRACRLNELSNSSLFSSRLFFPVFVSYIGVRILVCIYISLVTIPLGVLVFIL